MSVTENRIVKMVFDNSQFKKGAADSQKSLADLDKAVAGAGKTKGLLDLSGQMDAVRVKASAMQVAVGAAIATIATKATAGALEMVKSFTINPIRDGFAEYEKLLTSTQTIVANTGVSVREASRWLKELNHYSDQTVYNFGQMADNIGRFTAAGVKLPQAVIAIKGMANSAALAGSTTEQLNMAMYQMSQALSTGVIKLMDWNSLVNAGMGTENMRQAIMATAHSLGDQGKVMDAAIEKNGSFRDSLQEGWLTSEVFTKAMKVMAGTTNEAGKTVAFTVEEIQKMGYSEEAAKKLNKLSAAAIDSATKIKTFSQLLEVVKESLGSAWASAFRGIFGGLVGSSQLWTKVGTTITDTIGGISLSINRAIGTWRKLSGFQHLWGGIGNILKSVGNLLRPLLVLFRAIMPGTDGAGQAMAGMTEAFYRFSVMLERVTRGVTAWTPAITFVVNLIKAVIRTLINLTKSAGGEVFDFFQKLAGMVNIQVPDGGGIVDFIKKIASEIGKAVEKINDLLEKGKSLKEAFGSVDIKMPKMPELPDLGGIFGGKQDDPVKKVALLTAGVSKLSGVMSDAEKHRQDMSDMIQGQLTGVKHPDAGKMPDLPETGSMTFNPDAMVGGFEEASDRIAPATAKIGGLFDTLKAKFTEMIGGFNGGDLMASLNLAVLATFLISMSKMLNSVAGSGKAFVGVIESAGGALGSFQTAARAKLITAIAIAIGILALSLIGLSLIPEDKLGNGLLAMSIMLALMAGAIKALTASVALLDGKKTTPQLLALSVAIIALGLGMLMLAGALALMQLVDWNGIAKGLATMTVLMGGMIAIGKFAQGGSKQILAASLAIAAISASMILLAGALLLFKLVDWDDLGKAGAALAGLTLTVAGLALIPYQGISKVGLAMLTASLGIESLARALVIFGFVEWESMGKAGLALLGLTAALALLQVVGNPVAVGGMLGLALGMIGIATAGLILNSVDWESIKKAAVVLGMLVLAAAAFTVMALVLAAVAGPLALLAGALALLAIGVAAIGLAFAIVFPLLAAGAGVFAAFATGAAIAIAVFLQTLALQAPIMKDSILKIMQAAIDGIVEAVPMVIDGLQRLWAAIQKEFQDDNKKTLMGNSGKSWIEKLRDGIKAKIPEIATKAKELMIRFIRALADKAATIGAEAAKFVAKFISGIAGKIGGVIKAGADLAIKFIQGVGKESARIATAAADVIIKFINKMAETIRTKGPELGDAMGNLGIAMVEGLIGGIGAMFDKAMNKIGDLAGGMVDKAKGILKIFSPSRVFYNIGQFLVMGLTNGIQNNAAAAISAVGSMVSGQIAVANEFVDRYIQTLDQRAIAARAKADGLALAAKKAADAAKKTKTKTDDKAAERLQQQAQAAAQQASAAEAKANAAKVQQDRAEKWKEADSFERAKIRSEDAQKQLEAAKAAEARAAKNVAAANALDQQAKNKNLSPAERRRLEKEADRLREQARKDALYANQQLNAAKNSAADALVWQQRAGAEAAAAFEEQFKAEAKADADAEAFEKLTNEEKAKVRREEAAKLQALAQANLEAAKKLAYSDLDAANALAAKAMQEAEQARQFLDQAMQFETQGIGGGGPMGTVVNVDPTEAAAIAFNQYADLYDSATAAAAAPQAPVFNQYNTSPESLSPTEVYRQTNNLLTHAADKLQPVA